MNELRKSLSRLSVAEPFEEISAQAVSKNVALKNGWLRYRKKYFLYLNNSRVFRRYGGRHFKWPNFFVVLTNDSIHLFKSEFKIKTERTLKLADIERISTSSDFSNYEWCLKLEHNDPKHQPMVLAAPLQSIQNEWFCKIQEAYNHLKFGTAQEIDDDPEYLPDSPSSLYHVILLSDEEFANSITTYHGTRDELIESFSQCAQKGDFVIRKSRTENKGVLSVYSGTGSHIKEYLIVRSGSKITLNKKIYFDNVAEMEEYYQMSFLPKSTSLKLNKHFNTFKAVETIEPFSSLKQ